MPEYFLALVKQFGNFSTTDLAGKTSEQIVDALGVCLSAPEQQKINIVLPKYLLIPKKHFLLNNYKKEHKYSHDIFLARLMQQSGLTDESELQNRLRAFFYALAIVRGRESHKKLTTMLPPELQQFCIQYSD